MQKRRILAALLAVVLFTTVSCTRKGTGCPTFSLKVVEKVLSSK